MKIQAVRNYPVYNKTLFKEQKPSAHISQNTYATQISFGNDVRYEISGIAEPLFDSLFKDVATKSELDNVKTNYLSKNNKFSPSLAYLFLQTYDLGGKKRKEDSPGMSLENKNKFAFEYATNVFYALKDIKGEYDFTNLRDALGIIYQTQKSGKVEDFISFLFCSKDENTEKFQPDLARKMFKFFLYKSKKKIDI